MCGVPCFSGAGRCIQPGSPLFLGKLPAFVFLLAVCSLPVGKNAVEKIWRHLFCTEHIQSVKARILSCAGAASYTALEILYLGGLFLLSVANIVDASYNPFLYFRF